MNFSFKMMSFVLRNHKSRAEVGGRGAEEQVLNTLFKMMNIVFKMMDFGFKMMDFAAGKAGRARRGCDGSGSDVRVYIHAGD